LKKLKIILQSKCLYIVLICITFVNFCIVFTKDSPYTLEKEVKVIGKVDKISLKDKSYNIELKEKERLAVFYYIKNNQKKLKINLGDEVEIKGIMYGPENNRNFNLFNYRKYLLSKKIKKVIKADSVVVKEKNKSINYKLKTLINKRISKLKSKDYLKAYIMGSTEYLNEEVKESFIKNGISHLFAISGDSISIFITILVKILEKIFKNKKIINIICFLFLFFYMFITDYSPSVVRASVFFMLLTLNKTLNFNLTTIKVFIILFCIVLIYNPFYIYNLGFTFSYLISFSLIVTSNLINNYKKYFSKLFFVSSISFLVSLPVVINNYFEFNILSPILNLIFVPIIAFIIFPLSLITFIIPIFDNILFLFSEIFNLLSLFLSMFSLNVIVPKMNLISILIYYIILYKTILNMKKKKYKLLLLLYFFFYLFISNIRMSDTLTMIDVGQGDSTLIEYKNGKNILIDTGGKLSFDEKYDYSISNNTIIPYLKSRGIRKIDVLILTHGDADHMGESINIINKFRVSEVLMNSGSINFLERKLIKVLINKRIKYRSISNYEMKIGNTKLNILNKRNDANENEDSLIIYTKINKHNILLMGDAGIDTEKYLSEVYNFGRVDILKVGHHGSKHSSSKEFIDIVKPKVSLISAGKNNRYGHPNEKVVENLKYSKILNTIEAGMVKIILEKKIKIKTCL
jgi:DNA internalization-related competence protein ComEC/Rec2